MNQRTLNAVPAGIYARLKLLPGGKQRDARRPAREVRGGPASRERLVEEARAIARSGHPRSTPEQVEAFLAAIRKDREELGIIIDHDLIDALIREGRD